MRRKPEPRNTKPRRRRDADIPPVPTVRPAVESTPTQPPAPPAKEDPTEEAVRRMVEAAYT